MSDEVLMDTEEVARYLKVHVKTVTNLIERGELLASKVGRHWRFRKSDVDAYLERRLSRPRQDEKQPEQNDEKRLDKDGGDISTG